AGPLTPVERGEVERHAEAGRRLLAGSGNELLELAATVAWTHHENWDGSGYPRGLAAEAIPLAGRIVAVADVFDALTSVRPYRPAISEEDAFEHLEAESDRTFDPAAIAAFDRVRAGERPCRRGRVVEKEDPCTPERGGRYGDPAGRRSLRHSRRG